MSRSFKEPWIKDPANRYMKKIAARVYRRVTKQITDDWRKAGREQDDPEYPHRNALVNPWSVCDFIWPAWRHVNKKTGLVAK